MPRSRRPKSEVPPQTQPAAAAAQADGLDAEQADKPADKPAEKQADKQAGRPADKTSDKLASEQAVDIRVLKKYPNRRLYDTRSSSYITLAEVKQMVLDSEHFEVRDAKTGDDLTRSILLQVILEEESGGLPTFSTETLSQIIRFYGHSMQGMLATMIEKNLQAFAQMQSQFVHQSKGLYDPKHLSPEVWSRFMLGQPAALQDLMGSYVEQSKSLFEQMQQAGSLFPGIAPFKPPKK